MVEIDIMETKKIVNTITINAPIDKVWNVLVNPQQTKKYMFGCEALSDWKKGSELIWKMLYEGKDFIPVKGHIKNIEQPNLLEYTTFDPHSTIPDVPQNYLTVTYELKSINDSTELKVSQGDYNTVAEGKRRYEEAYNDGKGWDPILVEIKKVAEE